jgi:hypothetical protein
MATLAEIRAKLLAQDSKSADNANANRGSDAIYPFWNMDTDSTSVIRFLPDSDNSNTFFWRERQIIKMPFPGVKGGDESKPVTVQVPCIEMWGDTCPVHAEIRPWFKDPAMEDIGRKYWKKRSYIFQGFVVTDPMNEQAPENPIRRFVIGPQIFKLLKSALMDPDMENLPTDYDAGTDFRLTKTQKGQYADYSTSNWARKERSLNEEERQAVETNGLYNLNDFMPKRPNDEEVRIIMEMFEASVDGHLYDPEKWGSYYKPYGLDVGNTKPATSAPTAPAVTPNVVTEAPVAQNSTPAETSAPAPKAVATPQPAMAEAGAPASGGQGTDAADILKMIRSRKAD